MLKIHAYACVCVLFCVCIQRTMDTVQIKEWTNICTKGLARKNSQSIAVRFISSRHKEKETETFTDLLPCPSKLRS